MGLGASAGEQACSGGPGASPGERVRAPCAARGCAGLTPEELDHFQREGFAVARGLLGSEDLDPIVDEFSDVLTDLCRDLHHRGVLASALEELPFEEKYIRLIAESGQVFADHWRPTLPARLSSIREDTPMHVGPAVFGTIRNPRLLDAVESLIGEEIYANPIQNVRIKPPERCLKSTTHEQLNFGLTAATPWHQDNAVCTEDADPTKIVTVWFPLHDVEEDNGPLVLISRSHARGLQTHCVSQSTKEVHLPEEALEGERLTLPMRRGDVLFLHKHTFHASARNSSEHMRFSLDLRYNPIGQPTGRSLLPGFVARSRAAPDSELRDPASWAAMWYSTREALAQRATRTEAAKQAVSSYVGDEHEGGELLGRDRWLRHPDAILCA